jgi:peptidoglycan/xylan/chitin deacetylase (PgdA/CDA1 family)/folate-dependent phosphoribosylglycinamide formyltransferase PurN
MTEATTSPNPAASLMQSRPRLKVVVLSGATPASVLRLVSRITQEAPEVVVVGLLYELTLQRPLGQRIRRFSRNLRTSGFVPYVAWRAARLAKLRISSLGHRLLDLLHGSPSFRVADATIDDLKRRLAALGCRVHVTSDPHSSSALEFVKSLDSDLGVLFGTRILKPQLFALPRLGSINVHKREVPDYRGGGPIGLWELLDGRDHIGVTVHKVAEQVDTGEVLETATIPIEPFDNLQSLGLKADIVGEDLLVQVSRRLATGSIEPRPQSGAGRTYRSPPPAELRRLEKRLAQERPAPAYARSRPAWKLALRTILLGPQAVLRNWRDRRQASFPVVILYHHLIADSPHRMGMSTTQFKRQLDFLRRHYRIFSLTEAIAALRRGRVDQPTVVLTFDDGYEANYLATRAVLAAAGCSATFFVCTNHLTSRTPFRHDLDEGVDSFPAMSWEQAKVMQQQGYEIGSHTRSHFLCGSEDSERLRHELEGSRDDLRRELGEAAARYFAFPRGHPDAMSAVAVRMARETYEFVLSACGGVNRPKAGGPSWHLLRFAHPTDLVELELTLQSLLELDPAGPRLEF